MPLTSDPHAWLRPYFAALAQDPGFALLAPLRRFDLLCDAVAAEHPKEAAQMRDWSEATQEAAISWLAKVTAQVPPAREVELWRLMKGKRELRCLVRYVPAGLDLRLIQGDEFRRTELHRDAEAANAKATEWKAALTERGWA